MLLPDTIARRIVEEPQRRAARLLHTPHLPVYAPLDVRDPLRGITDQVARLVVGVVRARCLVVDVVCVHRRADRIVDLLQPVALQSAAHRRRVGIAQLIHRHSGRVHRGSVAIQRQDVSVGVVAVGGVEVPPGIAPTAALALPEARPQ